MYDLKQAALLAYEKLSRLLKAGGYQPIVGTSGMWKNTTRPTLFSLCVDDFGIKYFSQDDLHHLKTMVEKEYTATVDWKGTNYLGYTLDWQYAKGYVDLSMPGYIERLLEKLQYVVNKYPQYSPHFCHQSNWTKRGEQQIAMSEDSSPLLDLKGKKYVQQAVGSFLYYGRALDSTMLPAINTIRAQQALLTTNTLKAVQQLLDYANTYKDIHVRYYASDMQLHVDSDAVFLVLPKAKSRIAGYFRLLHKENNKHAHYKDNGPILIECKTLRSVVTSAAEAETHGVFHNAKKAIPIIYTLQEMGHPQLKPTPLRTDNSASSGFTNKNIVLKRYKFWDMQLHWLRDPKNKKLFFVYWDKGSKNGADYFTKHHPTIHHQQIREERKYVRDTITDCTCSLQNVVKHKSARVC